MRKGNLNDRDLTRRKFLGAAIGWQRRLRELPRRSRRPKPPRRRIIICRTNRITGPQNAALEAENPSAVWATETDSGAVPPFKYPFAHGAETHGERRMDAAGDGARAADFEVDRGRGDAVDGGRRARVALARVVGVGDHAVRKRADYGGGCGGEEFRVAMWAVGDLWLFPPGVPHSIQGLGPDGCQFLLVFDDGNFNEFETFLLTDWLTHTPKEVLAKNFGVSEATFDKVPKKELFIFQTGLPEDLKKEEVVRCGRHGNGAAADGFSRRAR